MGDFERIFGAGASIESIINGINSTHVRDRHQQRRENTAPSKHKFSSFQEALAWAKSNPGKTIIRASNGAEFIEK